MLARATVIGSLHASGTLLFEKTCRCARPNARSRQSQVSKWGVASLDNATLKVLFCLGWPIHHIVSPKVRRKSYRGPDFFVVKNVDGMRDRASWVVWKEDGRYPDVIVELASPSTIRTDLSVKKQLYEHTFRTSEYFCYDPGDKRLLGWQLTHGVYVELSPNEQGWLWSEELQVWLGTWEGEFQRVRATWLRFYTIDHQLVLTMAEAEARRAEAEAQRAETERQRAERLAAKLRELGVEPEAL